MNRSFARSRVTKSVRALADPRNGVVNYLGADGNNQSLTPAQLRSIDTGCVKSGTCPNGNGPNPAVLELWNGQSKLPGGASIPGYPLPNTPNSPAPMA